MYHIHSCLEPVRLFSKYVQVRIRAALDHQAIDSHGLAKHAEHGRQNHPIRDFHRYVLEERAYQLIMRDKERLLSFEAKLKFIFSHSALREGWDNPNVFQICTLNETTSVMKKRQEIGRGLRICVNQDGERVYGFEVNTLTVMANESYEEFARKLQKEVGIQVDVTKPDLNELEVTLLLLETESAATARIDELLNTFGPIELEIKEDTFQWLDETMLYLGRGGSRQTNCHIDHRYLLRKNKRWRQDHECAL